MAVPGLQKVVLPFTERVLLAELAERKGMSDTDLLAQLVRKAVREDVMATEEKSGEQQPSGA